MSGFLLNLARRSAALAPGSQSPVVAPPLASTVPAAVPPTMPGNTPGVRASARSSGVEGKWSSTAAPAQHEQGATPSGPGPPSASVAPSSRPAAEQGSEPPPETPPVAPVTVSATSERGASAPDPGAPSAARDTPALPDAQDQIARAAGHAQEPFDRNLTEPSPSSRRAPASERASGSASPPDERANSGTNAPAAQPHTRVPSLAHVASDAQASPSSVAARHIAPTLAPEAARAGPPAREATAAGRPARGATAAGPPAFEATGTAPDRGAPDGLDPAAPRPRRRTHHHGSDQVARGAQPSSGGRESGPAATQEPARAEPAAELLRPERTSLASPPSTATPDHPAESWPRNAVAGPDVVLTSSRPVDGTSAMQATDPRTTSTPASRPWLDPAPSPARSLPPAPTPRGLREHGTPSQAPASPVVPRLLPNDRLRGPRHLEDAALAGPRPEQLANEHPEATRPLAAPSGPVEPSRAAEPQAPDVAIPAQPKPRPNGSHRPAQRREQDSRPVQVRIGTVEVRGVTASTPAPPVQRARTPRGFDAYRRVRAHEG